MTSYLILITDFSTIILEKPAQADAGRDVRERVRWLYINEKQRMAAVLLVSAEEEMAVLWTSI